MNGKKRLHLHLWAPDLVASNGGIQRYLNDLVPVVSGYLSEWEITAVVKNSRRIPTNLKDALSERSTCCGRIWGIFRTLYFTLLVGLVTLRDRPALILCAHAHYAPLASLISRWFGVPYWVIVYGVEVWNEERRDLSGPLRSAERIVAISRFTAQKLSGIHGVSEQSISILPCTVQSERFNIRPRSRELLEKTGLSDQTKILLTVTRLESQEPFKPYDQVIQALPEIVSTVPDLHYLLVGEGSDRIRVEQLVKNLALERYVTVTGFIEEEDLPHYYNLADLFVLPSKLEGFGIVFLEALASGVPVVGGEADGARDTLRGGELGTLVNPDSTKHLAACVVQHFSSGASNTEQQSRIQLRDRVIQEYGEAAFKKRVAECFSSLCNAPGRDR